MTDEEKALLGALGGVAAIVPLVLGLTAGWPVWLWLPLLLALAAAPLPLGKRLTRRREEQRIHEEIRQQQEQRQEQQPEPAPSTHPSHQVADLWVPTQHPEYRLLFSATVHWIPAPGAAGPSPERQQAIAVDAIYRRACAVTAETGALDHRITEHRLSDALGVMLGDPAGHLRAWAQDVSLKLRESDEQRLQALGEAAKDEEIRQRRRDGERGFREYLTNDALSDTANAVVWWLAQEDVSRERLEEAVGLVDTLSQLSALAHGPEQAARRGAPAGQWVPATGFFAAEHSVSGTRFARQSFAANGVETPAEISGTGERQDPVSLRVLHAEHLVEASHPEDDERRPRFARRLADVLDEHGMSREAGEIRARYEGGGAAPEDATEETTLITGEEMDEHRGGNGRWPSQG
ncbi:hypothetical protein CDG81_08480 [Actinopolyspora erythraea]|uniref:PrgI family protein n=1 Tax=Actinopolyspora erythraea TaxID=414996 RepID=A0A099D860_9ACTN|nr:hypothetical protein [Actinopolyspora erythraea]ASU78320.1 hypothetical protein CDG81_08480 [Actinopolyspora erythraea]KGI81987.1 hypothetical protein IL38_08205 [Actinopolyspora erythraea]